MAQNACDILGIDRPQDVGCPNMRCVAPHWRCAKGEGEYGGQRGHRYFRFPDGRGYYQPGFQRFFQWRAHLRRGRRPAEHYDFGWNGVDNNNVANNNAVADNNAVANNNANAANNNNNNNNNMPAGPPMRHGQLAARELENVRRMAANTGIGDMRPTQRYAQMQEQNPIQGRAQEQKERSSENKDDSSEQEYKSSTDELEAELEQAMSAENRIAGAVRGAGQNAGGAINALRNAARGQNPSGGGRRDRFWRRTLRIGR